MKTRINLYLPHLRPVKEVLSLKQSLSVVLLSIVCGICVCISFYFINTNLEDEQVVLAQRLVLEESILSDKVNELAAVTTTAPLLNQIKAIKQKILEKKRVLAVLNTEFEDNIGFSPLFEGLSTLEMQDVWLTRIESKGGKLSFGGSALESKNIPRWVSELKASKVFNGHNFSHLEMKREDRLLNFTLYNANGFATKEAQ